MLSNIITKDPIIALATANQESAIAVVRLSGDGVIEIVDRYFFGKNLVKASANGVYYGKIKDDGGIIDECLVSVFRAPRSYTKEDSVEISCHGSMYIVQRLIKLFLDAGIRMAEPGEFTMRAYLNGQMDLAQAEAVADLISSKSSAQHAMAMNQLRGGFSKMIADLRQRLIKFASLIELENDFGEEDVEFADRTQLVNTVNEISTTINELTDSFEKGNAIKEGIPVAIVGKPNVGKSTLLNALLNEDKAIVSDVPGTTRDVIEDVLNVNGVLFRFFDTAGIRSTVDKVEKMGIERTLDKVRQANIVLFMTEIQEDHLAIVREYQGIMMGDHQKAIILLNKIDDFHACHSYDVEEAVSTLTNRTSTIALSAKSGRHLDRLIDQLSKIGATSISSNSEVVVSNIRHLQALQNANVSLDKVREGLQSSLPSDLVAMDIRHAMHYLGEISGEISTDDLLDSIFRDFCIGK